MIRIICFFLIVFFPSLSLATVKEWYNNPQYLTKIPKPSLGAAVMTKPGGGNTLPMVVALASDNSPAVNIASGVLSVPLYAYSPIAGAAGQYVLGKGLQAVVDLASSYSDGTLQSVPLFDGLIDEIYPSSDSPNVNDVLDSFGQCSFASAKKVYNKTVGVTLMDFPYDHQTCAETAIHTWETIKKQDPPSIYWEIRVTSIYLQNTSSPVNYPTQRPTQLDQTALSLLATKIAEQIANNYDNFKEALKQLFYNKPSLIPPVENITNNDIVNNSNQQIYDNSQEQIDYYTNKYNEAVTNNNTELANYYQDKIQEQQSEQQKQEAEQQKEETFSPLSDNPFEEPYNPGPYDIPARFTSFLNNVKSTGLFSFSSSFFNSLPGGGSPIYTVEAGTYGTHTVDLSETMGTGLAVLKTVLLLLFGFLSIRVVILKR